MKNELTHLDLFSGIGGFALAAQWAGFRTVGFSEVETHAASILENRFPGVPNIGDVRRRADFTRFRGCTVITGGFPCQPWSYAGERRGSADHRHLWPAMCDVIKEVRPAWIIGENVSGIISVGLEQVCLDLENLSYSTQPFVVPACAVGAWHRRDRVWIVAHANGSGKSQPEGDFEEGRGWLGDRAHSPSANATGVGRGQGSNEVRPWQSLAERDASRVEWGNSWPTESPMVRMVHGIPRRPHRVKALGNAIVPQVAERFLSFIAAIERGQT